MFARNSIQNFRISKMQQKQHKDNIQNPQYSWMYFNKEKGNQCLQRKTKSHLDFAFSFIELTY